MLTILNPFILGHYVSEKYFCDRQFETELLRKLIDNGRDVTISAKRRIGKTLLIEHFFASEYIQENYFTVYIDIYATSNLAELVYLLSKDVYSIISAISTIHINLRDQIERFFQIIPTLRVGLQIDPLSGEASFALKLSQITDPAKTLKQVFTYLDQQPRRIIIAIDEFQQVGKYPEKNTEALLRTYIQKSTNLHFIFAGSQMDIINNMFRSAAKPFYKSTQFMDVLPIPCEVYGEFATRLFKDYDRVLQPEVIPIVYDFCYGVTSDIQTYFNELFSQTPMGGVCTTELIEPALMSIIKIQNQNYLEALRKYTEKQKAILLAIASTQPIPEVTSSKFIEENGLKSARSVQSVISSLDKDGFFTREDDTIRISDVFFATWLSKY